MNYKELNLSTSIKEVPVKIDDAIELSVRTYLPIAEKISLITYVVDHALDESTGRFSPVRVGLFFDLAIAHFYGGIDFEDDVIALDAYDAMEVNGILTQIVSAIPQEEYDNIMSLVLETVKDIADYNSSFAGILQIASQDSVDLTQQIETALGQVKNREGLEILSEIKNVVGTD